VNGEDSERAQIRLQWLSVAAGEAVVTVLIVSLPWNETVIRVLLAGGAATVTTATAIAALVNPERFQTDARESTYGPSLPRPMIVGVLTVAVLLVITLIIWAAS
jgi:hypothetical protein